MVDGRLLFGASDGAHGRELWRSDGTPEGTVPVQDIAPGPTSSSPRGFVSLGDRIVFSASGETVGREPWIGRAAILAGQSGQAIQDLSDELKALGLATGIARSLLTKLDSAVGALTRPGENRAAILRLEDIMKEVEALSPRWISSQSAAELQEFAQEIIGLLDDASVPRGAPSHGAGEPRSVDRNYKLASWVR